MPSEELLRAVTLFVWGFEFYTNRMRRHFGQKVIWRYTVPREDLHKPLHHLGIREHFFHGFGVRITDEHGLVFDGDFLPLDLEDDGRSSLTWVDPWKLRYFLESLPAGCEEFRALSALDDLENAVRAIPQDWMQALMREARQA